MECLTVSQDELSDLLRSLPRRPVSRDFTARTVALAGGRHHAVSHLRSVLAVVLSAILLLSGAIGIRRHQQQLRVQQMRAQQQEIRQELEALKALSDEREPRIFVGGSGSVDFVMGLKQRPRPTASAQPVSLHIANDGIY